MDCLDLSNVMNYMEEANPDLAAASPGAGTSAKKKKEASIPIPETAAKIRFSAIIEQVFREDHGEYRFKCLAP